MAQAHRRRGHDASRACAAGTEFSTRAGEKGAYRQGNSCGQGDFGGMRAGEAGGGAGERTDGDDEGRREASRHGGTHGRWTHHASASTRTLRADPHVFLAILERLTQAAGPSRATVHGPGWRAREAHPTGRGRSPCPLIRTTMTPTPCRATSP